MTDENNISNNYLGNINLPKINTFVGWNFVVDTKCYEIDNINCTMFLMQVDKYKYTWKWNNLLSVDVETRPSLLKRLWYGFWLGMKWIEK